MPLEHKLCSPGTSRTNGVEIVRKEDQLYLIIVVYMAAAVIFHHYVVEIFVSIKSIKCPQKVENCND